MVIGLKRSVSAKEQSAGAKCGIGAENDCAFSQGCSAGVGIGTAQCQGAGAELGEGASIAGECAGKYHVLVVCVDDVVLALIGAEAAGVVGGVAGAVLQGASAERYRA